MEKGLWETIIQKMPQWNKLIDRLISYYNKLKSVKVIQLQKWKRKKQFQPNLNKFKMNIKLKNKALPV